MGIIKSLEEELAAAGKEIVSRPKAQPGQQGEPPAGTLTANVGNSKLLESESLINSKTIVQKTPLDTYINTGDVSKPDSFYKYTGSKIDLSKNDVLTIGELTSNINPKPSMSYTEPSLGTLTPNIGNALNTLYTNDVAGVMTPNVDNNDLDVPTYIQKPLNKLTPNIGNNINDLYIEPILGNTTKNIDNKILNNPMFIQDAPGVLTSNIDTDLKESYKQDKLGKSTPNVDNNDLDTPTYKQNKLGKLTQNIDNEKLNELLFKQKPSEKLTKNINNPTIKEDDIIQTEKIQQKINLDVEYEQPIINDIEPKLGNIEIIKKETIEPNLKILFGNDIKKTNIDNDLKESYIQKETVDKKVNLGEQYNNIYSVYDKKINDILFDNNLEHKNIGEDLKTDYINPVINTIKNNFTKQDDINTEVIPKETKLDSTIITESLLKRKNIGNDLGNIYDKKKNI